MYCQCPVSLWQSEVKCRQGSCGYVTLHLGLGPVIDRTGNDGYRHNGYYCTQTCLLHQDFICGNPR